MPQPARRLLDHYRHPLVRDLAWILLAPDLIEMPGATRPSRRELGLDDDDRLVAWLGERERSPGYLEAHLAPTLRGRMGLYHERLWQFLLDEAPATRLLAHNLRIHQGKRTLGELDLLYCRLDDPRPVHLEVAIKYYLGLAEGPGMPDSQARWIGPGGADSLSAKRERLFHHQLRLAETAEAREALHRLMSRHWPAGLSAQATDIAVRMAMPGVLFFPWHTDLPSPREATVRSLRGQWLFRRDWRAFQADLPEGTCGAWLHKPHWLALPHPETLERLSTLDRRLAAHFRVTASPVQLALYHPEAGERRLFLVPDDWPHQIPLPPSPLP
ncbi:hypothetical protein BOX17_15025 [Halomonas aestuarii]|uniref:DUF1853 domain-containing protein n=1 Tax=Halomonas aestuarii TaxID=1897729 RepID=A0A1J0VJF3_9GAMM|nr:DUF1853 family protein [Halomonas aestuarii]APE32145.1 hypothetical protein BOX17_15025 [Halomonas aestuarii]